MAALPLTISLMVFTGRPERIAKSRWVIPSESNTSASVSPGGTAKSGIYRCSLLFAMIIHHFQNADFGNLFQVDASVVLLWDRIMVWNKDYSERLLYNDGKLALPSTL
jgi:hypothetical protein